MKFRWQQFSSFLQLRMAASVILILLFVTAGSRENSGDPCKPVSAELYPVHAAIRQIIAKEMVIELTNGLPRTFRFEANGHDLSNILYVENNGKPRITVQRPIWFDSLILDLPGTNLKTFVVNRDAAISTRKLVQTGELDIMLNGSSVGNTTTPEKIKVSSNEEYEFFHFLPITLY